jgi:hypothetical protein
MTLHSPPGESAVANGVDSRAARCVNSSVTFSREVLMNPPKQRAAVIAEAIVRASA